MYMGKANNKGINENGVKTDNELKRKAEARILKRKSAVLDLGKNYERVPHPTLKNTFILKEIPKDKME